MESLVVHPENAEQLEAVKVFLRALKVEFEPKEETLPPHVLEGIQRSIEQFENGETISLEDFKAKHLFKKIG